jgi:hypothetical protein
VNRQDSAQPSGFDRFLRLPDQRIVATMMADKEGHAGTLCRFNKISGRVEVISNWLLYQGGNAGSDTF